MKNSLDVAELIGRHIADGYLVKNPARNGYRVVLTECLKIAEDSRRIISENFDFKSIKIEQRGKVYALLTYSKSLYEFIEFEVGLPQQKHAAEKLVTKWMLTQPLESRTRIVRGIIDCDGSLYLDNYSETWTLVLNIIHQDVVEFVSKVLEQLEIRHKMFVRKSKHGNRKVSFALRVTNKDNIMKYLKLIGSCKYSPEFATGSKGAPG